MLLLVPSTLLSLHSLSSLPFLRLICRRRRITRRIQLRWWCIGQERAGPSLFPSSSSTPPPTLPVVCAFSLPFLTLLLYPDPVMFFCSKHPVTVHTHRHKGSDQLLCICCHCISLQQLPLRVFTRALAHTYTHVHIARRCAAKRM